MNNIRKARKANGLTQVELAEKLGVTQGNLSAWETGRWQPDVESIKHMCDLLNCSADFLLGRDVPPVSEIEWSATNIYFNLALEMEKMGLPEEDVLKLFDLAKYFSEKNGKKIDE